MNTGTSADPDNPGFRVIWKLTGWGNLVGCLRLLILARQGKALKQFPALGKAVTSMQINERIDVGENRIRVEQIGYHEYGFVIHGKLTREIRLDGVNKLPRGFYPPQIFYSVKDDRGNVYKTEPGFVGGLYDEWRFGCAFRPAVSRSASTIHLRVARIQWLNPFGITVEEPNESESIEIMIPLPR